MGTVFQQGCQATEASRHGIPLVEADATAKGVASRCTLGTLLSRHLQELPSLAGEGWRTHREEVQGEKNPECVAPPSFFNSIATVQKYNADWGLNGFANHCCIFHNASPLMRELNPYILLHTVSFFALCYPLSRRGSRTCQCSDREAFPHTWSCQWCVGKHICVHSCIRTTWAEMAGGGN